MTAAVVIGLSGSRGMCGPIQGTPTTSASTGSSNSTPRLVTPRTSASTCATDGRPAKAPVAYMCRLTRLRMSLRSESGSMLNAVRSGEDAKRAATPGSFG